MGLRESVRGELVDSASRTEVHNEERGHGAPNSALTIPPDARAKLEPGSARARSSRRRRPRV